MLSFRDITLSHGNRILVRDISFTIAPGECVLLAGPNGSGKTTLLKALSHRTASAVLIPTGIPKVKGFTVEAFIETGCYRSSDWRGRISAKTRERLEGALDLLGIHELKDRDIATLSDGEFQKACLAVALTREAELLLLDEPTAFLDVEGRVAILRTLRDVTRKTGISVLFSSHELHESLSVVDRVLALTRDGRFLQGGPDDKFLVIESVFPNFF